MNALPENLTLRTIEQVSTRTSLGIRFWDAATDTQIRAGLRVMLWPELSPRLRVPGRRSVSDIYAFHRIPGLRSVETPLPGEAADLGSPPVRDYVIEVRDDRDRFVPVAFGLTLPRPGSALYLNEIPAAGGLPAPGFYLFTAANRVTVPAMGVIRGDLVRGSDGRPAAHALVTVEIPGEPLALSISDSGGRFAIHLPLPTLRGGLASLDASPMASPLPPVAERDWPFTLTVHSEPGALAPLPGTDLPDLRSILQQAPATIRIDTASPPLFGADWAGILSYGGEVVVSTAGRSSLEIEAAGSPPL